MINLDETTSFPSIDPQNMLEQIDRLPEQLETAWELGKSMALPGWEGFKYILIAGMGGSAISADLLAAYALHRCPVPIIVHRDYGLPAWVRGPDTLLIASSHSGDTEETLSSFDVALKRGCQILSVATGGKLAAASRQAGVPLWTFEHHGQPRAAVGFSFSLLMAAITRLGLLPDPSAELAGATGAMRSQQASLRAEIPVVQNPAKRMAGQMVGRWVTVFGADALAPVARRWKGQINELAKSWAQFESLPEADHNTLAGTLNPEDLFSRTMVLFLTSASDHPRNRLRSELTRKALMLDGLNTDIIQAQGDSPLAHQWTALHFGDYTAYYLAMAYGADPTPIAALQGFKAEMQAAGSGDIL